MDFNFPEGVMRAGDMKKENENIKKIKADIISASDTEEKKAIYKYFNGEAIIDSLSMSTDTAKKAKELIKSGQIRLDSVTDDIRTYNRNYFYYEPDVDVYGRAVAKVD